MLQKVVSPSIYFTFSITTTQLIPADTYEALESADGQEKQAFYLEM